MKIVAPVVPNRGIRSIDAWGVGGFGAPRRRDCYSCNGTPTAACELCGGSGVIRYQHKGIDFLAHPGDLVVSPTESRVTHIGQAYRGSHLRSVHLVTEEPPALYRIKMFYVEPNSDIFPGARLYQGNDLGKAQDVAARYGGNANSNHVHLEVHVADAAGVRVADPTAYLTRMVQA